MSVQAVVDWEGRQVSAAEAVSVVKPGDKVFVGTACSTPLSLVEALHERMVPGVTLVHFIITAAGVGASRDSRYRHLVFYVGRASGHCASRLAWTICLFRLPTSLACLGTGSSRSM